MTNKALLLTSTLLFLPLWGLGAWAWEGSGTVTDPYRIETSADWKQLADDVSGGNAFSGEYFTMTADIDAQGVSIGSIGARFMGTFDGGGHTLTYNRGSEDNYVDDYCSPFVFIEAATIRHLNVTGRVYTSRMYAAGIVSSIENTVGPSTIDDCHVSTHMRGAPNLDGDASMGGLIALVQDVGPHTNGPIIRNCSFTGSFGMQNGLGGLVSWTNMPVTFEHCMYDGEPSGQGHALATYVRTPENMICPMTECYYTNALGLAQGEGVFRECVVPEGCSYRFVSEPNAFFNGVEYYTSGTVIELTAPDDVPFDHWESDSYGCWFNDPWQRSGQQTLRDINHTPAFHINPSMIEAKMEREMDGTLYRYLYRHDYHLYISDEEIAQKSYHFDENGELFKWDADGNHVWITAVVGWKGDKIPSDGAQIHNDLSGWFRDHTFMGVIAPHAFDGCLELNTLYFKDTDANNYNASAGFDFIIGDKAFANCPNLTEVKMMQYTTRGDNHWEALSPGQVTRIGKGVFSGSPQAYFSTDIGEYQNYLSSETWKDYQTRIIVYNHTNVDFTTNGSRYSYMRNTKGEPLKNDADGHTALMPTLQTWNADYQDFTAVDLLAPQDDKNIWYTYIVGCDDDYLKSNDGTLRVYNDPGSYYNYKTLAIGRNAFKGSKELKKIEFWQTNGRSENSYTDLKMVIQNGAFKDCSNLQELRMFYYVQDGDDHWETLGPKDVIPGDNIFGLPTADEMEGMSGEELNKKYQEAIPEGFKIIVSPDRYQEFLDDPNWLNYQSYIEPTEFNPNNSDMKDFSLGGLTYSYMTSDNGIMQTSQTVSQDVSWWTAPRIAIEVAIYAATLGSAYATARATATKLAAEAEAIGNISILNVKDATVESVINQFYATTARNFGAQIIIDNPTVTSTLISQGFMTEAGTWVSKEAAFRVVEEFPAYMGNLMKINFAIYSQSCARHITTALLPKVIPSMANSFAGTLSLAGATTTASYLASKHWGGTGSYNGDLLQKGMRANILSNMHQVGLVGGGYVITTPQKNLCYHTYIKDVPASTTEAIIYAGTGKGQGRNNNARTMTMAKQAFRDHTNLKTVKFHETGVQSDEALPMLFTIPDSAFVGCTNLERFDLRVETEDNGQQALGPESFIFGGDSIFAGLDPAKFHIIIDPSRKQDFLDNESWAPLERYFVYEEAQPKTQYKEYGGNYAYAYENGTTQKVNKVNGHKIEHTVVTGADDEFLNGHQGALKLCNDIGVWNNYQLDAVTKKAFRGNESLRVVNFTDLMGTGAFGDSYTDLQMTLMDSCFADCKNLANLDLLYLVTDGTNHIDPIKPSQVTIGTGVFDGTTASIKMMPQQVEWFEADTTWNKYKDRFTACIIKPSDEGIKSALKPMAYYDMAHTGYDPTTWDDYIDLARISGAGFSWLDGKFREQSDDIRTFADFKQFESVGLDYVGKEWFRGCRKMTNIMLPKTIKTIQDYAFASCSSLQEIELPAALTEIGSCAFADCQDLRTVRVLATTPATLSGTDQFQKNEGLRIYVPAAAVEAYKKAWTEYKDYIVSDDSYKINKVVTLTEPGTLADKLGLYVEWSYSGLVAGDEPRYVHGNYSKYDSLTISGPLNDLDLNVIRYLCGTESYDRSPKPTDGRLRYLNLYNASIKKDGNCKAHYLNAADLTGYIGWHYITEDNVLPELLFWNCSSLESVILPKSLTKITSGIFINCTALKHVAVTGAVKEYCTWESVYRMLSNPIEELVFLTDGIATSTSGDPWTQPMNVIYTKKSQVGDYMNQPNLTRQTQTVTAPFEDDAVMETLAEKGHFFPSAYTKAEQAENIFNDNTTVKTFDEFKTFSVRTLDRTFANASALQRISLPDSLKSIGVAAFSGCVKLDTIRVACEQVPTLAEHSFSSLPADFRILVPKDMAVRYREQWAEYADHINVDESNYSDSEWTVVTLDKPNTLAEKLGFQVTWDYRQMTVFNAKHNYINGIRGDYSKIHKLKVNGPISGSDFALMRYLAGFCPWSNTRNMMGQLEAIDLYDADIKASDDIAAPDMFKVITHMGPSSVQNDNELPSYALLQAYNLKSLVLPKSCTKINTRALQQCEALETLVLGDDLTDFDWSALDDDASLTRLYIMARQKPKMDVDNWLFRQLYNNYNPTFDAFYVRPSLYDQYLSDREYTYNLQRTNLISKGEFDDDDSFCAFARHAAATKDDLAGVKEVEGWFDAHPGAKNLTPLQYTSVDSLTKKTFAPLTQLEQMVMPASLKAVEKGLLEHSKKLRYIDFLQCEESADLMDSLRYAAHTVLGLDEKMTLLYMPAAYDNVGEDNVVVQKNGKLQCEKYWLIDSLDYMVPYAFETVQIENTRKLPQKIETAVTVCLPYAMEVPDGVTAYKLSQRASNTLVFKELAENEEMETLHPYLLMTDHSKSNAATGDVTLSSFRQFAAQTIPASTGLRMEQDDAPGYSIRGTLKAIGNKDAADLGAYILQSDGGWHPVRTSNTKAAILPYRAYLLPSARNAAARIGMTLEDSEPDGFAAGVIDTIQTIDRDGTTRTYDLQGRETSGQNAKGIVVKNGKKVMAK